MRSEVLGNEMYSCVASEPGREPVLVSVKEMGVLMSGLEEEGANVDLPTLRSE